MKVRRFSCDGTLAHHVHTDTRTPRTHTHLHTHPVTHTKTCTHILTHTPTPSKHLRADHHLVHGRDTVSNPEKQPGFSPGVHPAARRNSNIDFPRWNGKLTCFVFSLSFSHPLTHRFTLTQSPTHSLTPFLQVALNYFHHTAKGGSFTCVLDKAVNTDRQKQV